MILISLVLALLVVTIFLRYIYSYWNRKGFPYIQPTIPFGNLETFRKQEQSFGVSVADLYNRTKEPFIGIYLFFRPALLICDADLVKQILTDDFTSFHDRGVHSNKKNSPLSANLFNLKGKEWKDMRSIISPTFTSGQLKRMFSAIENVGNAMEKYLESVVPTEGKVVELKDLSTKYSMDIIISAFFGVEINSFENSNHVFNEVRDKILGKEFLSNLAQATVILAPKLYDWLQLWRVNSKITKHMIDIVQDTIDFREKTHTERKDFMQLLIQLRNTGTIKVEGDLQTQSKINENKKLTVHQIAAQAFVFFIAGVETTASTISFCLYELTQNEDIKKKLMEDIGQTLDKHGGQVSYDSIQDMKYLELVVMETLRKYPGLPMLNRECCTDYRIPGSSLTIEKGTAIVISMLGLHRDPKYFRDPLKFDPERFHEENKQYNPNAYIPFGEGPRTCIGFRQGKLSAKVCIVKMLIGYKMDALEKRELEFDNYALLTPKGGVNVRLTRILK